MDRLNEGISSIPGISKAILVIRKMIVCLRKASCLVMTVSIYFETWSDCNGKIVE